MNTIRLFQTLLFIALVLTLYFTTTPVEYTVSKGLNDKLSHLIAFLFLSFLTDYSFPEKNFSFLIIYSLGAYGLLIECIQYFLPYRTFSFLDFLADLAGVLLYTLMFPMLFRLKLFRVLRNTKTQDV